MATEGYMTVASEAVGDDLLYRSRRKHDFAKAPTQASAAAA